MGATMVWSQMEGVVIVEAKAGLWATMALTSELV